MQHLLRCPLLENECSLEDLATANEKALHCARAWPNIHCMTQFGDDGHEKRIWMYHDYYPLGNYHPQTFKGWDIGLGLGSGVWVGEGKGSELASDSKCPRTHLDERGQM